MTTIVKADNRKIYCPKCGVELTKHIYLVILIEWICLNPSCDNYYLKGK